MSEQSEWPAHVPACCPPSDAVDAAGELFYAAHQPVLAEDLLSAKERGAYAKDDECLRAALSFWSARDRVEALLRLPSHRGKALLRAALRAEHGRMKQTGKPEHYSVWFRAVWHAKLHEVLSP